MVNKYNKYYSNSGNILDYSILVLSEKAASLSFDWTTEVIINYYSTSPVCRFMFWIKEQRMLAQCQIYNIFFITASIACSIISIF